MKNISLIIEKLDNFHKNAVCELDYRSSFELLVAVILSAQCTDKRVNEITPVLFKKYDSIEKLANAKQEDVEKIIFSCGFYKNKAKNIIAASKAILEKYNGEVPSTQEELVKLPGVGRKTANVIFAVAYGGNAIAVDTHVFRVSRRIGLTKGKTPDEVERDLMRLIDENLWSHTHHLLIHHGRYVCNARNPECQHCPIRSECDYIKNMEDKICE